ncbi:uncharacterized protein LOC126924353 [Bombus affinis]|uniref:uncharacterized protein LOC126924353 n=1 Tax=Bombus affinis TaxID=309941 RepID=UPI0021B71833|nr:uncharacterized protein LOC126924353 [Bombus affinis]
MQSIGTPSQSMPKFSNTASKKSPSRNKPRSRTIGINNATSGRLPTILLQLPGRPGLRFLVDSGAGINLLKQRCYPGKTTIPGTKKFSMGHSEYESNSKVKLNLFDKKIDLSLIDDDFPIIEDGVLGLPGLNQYRFELSNETLKLDNNTLLLQQEPTLAPGETVQKIVYLEGKPTPVCFINGDKEENTLLAN